MIEYTYLYKPNYLFIFTIFVKDWYKINHNLALLNISPAA